MKEIYLFKHVAKTGGLTVRHHLVDTLSRDRTILEMDAAHENTNIAALQNHDEGLAATNSIRIIIGHAVNLDILPAILDRKARWITIFRDPAERCISQFNYRLQNSMKGEAGYDGYHSWDDTGLVQLPSIWRLLDECPILSRRNEQILGFCDEFTTLLGSSPPADLLDRALEITEKFWIVARTPSLFEDLQPLFDALGVPPPSIRANVSPRFQLLTDELREHIYKKNPLDKLFYEEIDRRLSDRQTPLPRPA